MLEPLIHRLLVLREVFRALIEASFQHFPQDEKRQ